MGQGSPALKLCVCGHTRLIHNQHGGIEFCNGTDCNCSKFVEAPAMNELNIPDPIEQWCNLVTDDAIRTDLDREMYPNVTLRLSNPKTLARLAYVMNMMILTGNELDILKKHLFYGKPLPESVIGPYPDSQPLERLSDYNTMRLLHAAIGMGTEAAEILQQMSGHIFNGAPLDYANLEEEYGDSSWYMRLAVTALRKFTGGGLYQMILRNIAKLKKRYPEKFTAELALNRDLDSERKIFDQQV
jgi:hypothetical protein